MRHKDLILHAVALLGQHHDYTPITSLLNSKNSKTGVPLSDDEDVDIRHIVDEDEVCRKYFQENEITDEDDQTFLEEVLKGCVRWKKIVRAALEHFFVKTGCRYLRADYNFFAVFFYLIIVRLTDLGFTELSKFISQFDAPKMHRMMSFLFNEKNLNGSLSEIWGRIMDTAYVEEHFVGPIKNTLPEARDVLRELKDKVELGENAPKSKKPLTQSKPFLLTKPRPRKFIPPPIKISTLIKARPIPPTIYQKTSTEAEKLELRKQQNRELRQQKYDYASKTQFEIANKPPVSQKTKEKLQKLKQEQEAKRSYIKSATLRRDVPASTHAPSKPVKLTAAAILREDALLRKQKLMLEKALEEAEMGLKDETAFAKWQEENKARQIAERALEMERRKLEVQLAHEEAVAAKEALVEEKKTVVAEVREEKERLKEIAEEKRKEEVERNKSVIEEVQAVAENVQKARQTILEENKIRAAELAKQMEKRRLAAEKEAKEELERKAELIKQIRLLEKSVPSVGSVTKIVDFTETSGAGLLGEMSVIELQERLALLKVREAEEESQRRAQILQSKQAKMDTLTKKLEEITSRRTERKLSREMEGKKNKGAGGVVVDISLKEVLVNQDPTLRELQNKLREKKEARLAKSLPSTKCSTPSLKTPRQSMSMIPTASAIANSLERIQTSTTSLSASLSAK